jgi:hypothetical protein
MVHRIERPLIGFFTGFLLFSTNIPDGVCLLPVYLGRGLALVVALRLILDAGPQPPALELITLLLFLTSVLSQQVLQ